MPSQDSVTQWSNSVFSCKDGFRKLLQFVGPIIRRQVNVLSGVVLFKWRSIELAPYLLKQLNSTFWNVFYCTRNKNFYFPVVPDVRLHLREKLSIAAVIHNSL